MAPRNKVVFISCGQATDDERALGRSIAQLIEQLTPFQAYLAQNQSSLQGLTRNILKALNRCAGLIIVMHPRGKVSGGHQHAHTRGSVWIEQEIAIAAFLTQVLHRNLKVAAFVHKDVYREGMRDELQLIPQSSNPMIRYYPSWSRFSTGGRNGIITPKISRIAGRAHAD